MQELIKVNHNAQGEQVVSARDLYEFLEVKTKFTDWCGRMFDYGFIENQDYVLLPNFEKQNGRGGSNAIDYALTLDTAKEIAMLQRSEKGKQARQYFIECEKRLRKYDSDKAMAGERGFSIAFEGETTSMGAIYNF